VSIIRRGGLEGKRPRRTRRRNATWSQKRPFFARE
jgi:hypothetical protein